MTDPIEFSALTPRHALPLLVAGQAQREFFVNEALARIDLLLHPSVGGEAADAPGDPAVGECWLVAEAASGAWSGRDGCIAGWDGTQWTFCPPSEGMLLYDRSTGERLSYAQGWRRAGRPAEPSGGTTVDAEARMAVAALIDILATLSLIPAA